jgi:hypothetical protein
VGDSINATFGLRFEAIESKRARFNNEFRNQINQSGVKAFRSFLNSQRSFKREKEDGPMDADSLEAFSLLGPRKASKNVVKMGRVITSPAENSVSYTKDTI